MVYKKLLKRCFTSTETVGLLGTGAQDVHLDFHTAPEFWDAMLLPLSTVQSIHTNLLEVGGQLRGNKECPFNGVTNSGSVWRKVPDGDAWSQTPSTGLRYPSSEKGAGKQCSECVQQRR